MYFILLRLLICPVGKATDDDDDDDATKYIGVKQSDIDSNNAANHRSDSMKK